MYIQRHIREPGKAASRGVTLIELLVVMVVAAILAGIAIPSFRDIKANNELTTAQEDVAQMLRKARTLAQGRSTISSVVLSQATPPTAVLTLLDGSPPITGSASETLTLPSSVSIAATVTFQFDSVGNSVGANQIVLRSASINNATRTINVSALGSLELLRN